MISFDLRKLQQRLEKSKPAALYLLVGEESFLMDETIALLRSKTISEDAADFNFDRFFAADTAASHVKDVVETLPVMSPRRMVVYRDVDQLKDKDWLELMPVLERPVESTVLVLTCESIDKRKKAFKSLAETGILVDLKRPYENQLGDWIEYLAFRQGLTLDAEAAQAIKQFVGANLTELNAELQKLKEFMGERTHITTQDVYQVVSRTKVERIFDLTDAIGNKDRIRALQCLANLLEHRQSEIGALAMITRHMRILATLKQAQAERLTGPKLSAKAGVPLFLLPQYVEQSRRWNESEIDQTFAALHETDKALKSSPLAAHIWLENFILKTCSQ